MKPASGSPLLSCICCVLSASLTCHPRPLHVYLPAPQLPVLLTHSLSRCLRAKALFPAYNS